MARLIYLMNVSLDGYVADRDGGYDWPLVDDELHRWFNEQMRTTVAMLYGRRIHEVMAYWRTSDEDPDATPTLLEFGAAWRETPKVVFSRTVERLEPAAETDPRTRLADADPVEELERLKAEFDGDISVAGPTLAAEFVRRDLVDVYRVVVHPIVLGAGLPFWPSVDRPLPLRLAERREFGSGVVYLGYERVR